MACAALTIMAVGYIFRVFWIGLLLFGGSLPFPLMKGYTYPSTAYPEATAEDNKLANYPTGMLDLYSLVKGYSDRVPLAAAPKQALLNPEQGARIQGAVELGQETAKIEDWKQVGPVTFPLRPPYQHDYSFEEQWGSRKPMFPLAYEPSTKPSSELAGSDLIPPTPYLLMANGAFSSDPTFESKQVSTSDVYFNPTQNLNFQAGEREGSQIYAEQPSSWSSASYMTKGEEPVFSKMGQAAPTVSAPTLWADTVSSSDAKGDYSSSALQLDVQAGSQSYSPNLVYEDVFHYPPAETAQIPSEEPDLSNYNSVGDHYDSAYAVEPSTWPSADYMSGGAEPVYSSHAGDWAHVAPVETPIYPSYVAPLGLDSTSSKGAAQPVLFQPLKKAPRLPTSKWLQRPKKVMDQTAATFLVQSKGGYTRERKVLSTKKYFSGFPPRPQYVMALQPKSEPVKGKW